MKSFLRFFSEASSSSVADEARRKGLVARGPGNWYDRSGRFVAKTEGGRLVPVRAGEQPKQEARPTRDEQPKQKAKATPEEKPQEKQEKPESLDPANAEDTVTLVFGRFNPPTIGHKKVLDRAAALPGDMKVYPSRSYDPKKNPLDPDTKVDLMKKMYPKHSDVIYNDSDIKTIFDALATAEEEGYKNVNIVVGSDRVSEFDSLANKYNGEEGYYNFDSIQTISAGERDSEAAGVAGVSASKMRKAALENDIEAFAAGMPKDMDPKDIKSTFEILRKRMNVKEDTALWEVAPKFDWKNLRENYVKGNIFKIDQLVENLNTGLVGKVLRRGTNYLICVTENNMMFKSWIRDLNEYTEVKMDRKMRTKNKPNTLTGTTGYFKYAADVTPGFNKGDDTNLQPGGKPYKGPKTNIKEFINRYKKRV